MNIDNIKQYGKYIIAIGLIIIIFATGYFINTGELKEKSDKKNQKSTETVETVYEATYDKTMQKNENQSTDIGMDSSNSIMKAEIKGAIISPGVYEIKEGDRVEDLVKKSGGFQKDADMIRIKLAHKLQDEEIVYVYKHGEEENVELGKLKDETGGVISKSVTQQAESKKININVATKEELMKLPGVGEVKAQAIMQYREENGGFKTVEDLKNVSGIGEKTLSKFIQLVDTK